MLLISGRELSNTRIPNQTKKKKKKKRKAVDRDSIMLSGTMEMYYNTNLATSPQRSLYHQ